MIERLSQPAPMAMLLAILHALTELARGQVSFLIPPPVAVRIYNWYILIGQIAHKDSVSHYPRIKPK
jgi:hypothetical protein